MGRYFFDDVLAVAGFGFVKHNLLVSLVERGIHLWVMKWKDKKRTGTADPEPL